MFETFMRSIGAGAQHLLASVAAAETSIHKIEASNPLVATAAHLAVAEAQKLGVPVTALEAVGSAVLSAARAFATHAAGSAS